MAGGLTVAGEVLFDAVERRERVAGLARDIDDSELTGMLVRIVMIGLLSFHGMACSMPSKELKHP
jgi:hypothetical protein